MIDTSDVVRRFAAAGLARWAEVVPAQLHKVLHERPHGDWPSWHAAIDNLPTLGGGGIEINNGAVWLRPDRALGVSNRAILGEALARLHPWRKGPYRIDGLLVDTEWRSDWKWDRLEPHIHSLDQRLVLDVGCGNGYHAWRCALAGARFVVGVDPTAVFLAQYLAVSQLAATLEPAIVKRVHLQPVGIEGVPEQLERFDTVFSMGVLYHRRSPVDHLVELKGALRPGGQLVLETLVVEGEGQEVLVPSGRYAKMRNVWFIPTTVLLEVLLQRVGFQKIRTVDVSVTTLDEQRSTPWMRFESLADFLDPADRGLTVEGYPAPRRAVVIADAA